MNFIQHRYKLIAALIALPNIAFAEIEGITFTSVMQEQTTLTASSAMAINPVLAQSMNIFVSAGLDRKLKLYWLSSGVKLNEVNTGVIGVSDRLSFSGKDFYGKSIELKAPSADGNYTLQAELLSAEGTFVGIWSVPVIIDTNPPSGDVANFTYAPVANGGSVTTYYPGNFGSLKLSGLTDAGSGLKKATYIVKSDATGAVLGSATAQVDFESSSVYVANAAASLFSEGRTWYQAGFRVFDDAGNYTDITTRSLVDNGSYTRPSPTELWDPVASAWKPYTAGMVVYNNPFKVRYRRLYSETKEVNGDWGWSSFGYREGDYVYNDYSITYPVASGYWNAPTPSGFYVYSYYSAINVTLADGVGRNPIKPSPTLQWFDENGNSGGASINSGSYRKVVRIRLFSESMPYEQLAVLSSHGSCVIPVGSTFCDLAISREFSSGKGYTPYTYTVYSSVNGVSDGRFGAHFDYWYTYWDFIPPTIESISVTGDTVTVNVYDTNTTSDWTSSLWVTNMFRLQSSLGAEISHDSWIVTGTGKHRVTFKLNKMPSGRQNVFFYAQDNYGNRTTQLVLSNYLNDTTPPVLKLQSPTGAAISSGSAINGLESLRISIADDSDASITSVVLSGGAASDTVYVSTNNLGDGLYDLNYPRIFPSLEANETYTIKITGQDTAGNASTLTSTFLYLPANLLQVGQMTTLAVNKQLQNTQNDPITSIKTGVLRTAEGQLASGAQTAFITLRSDAKINVNILGSLLQPGETKQITIIPSITGEVVIPVYSASPGVKGQASFMIDIPQITSTN
ncbi:Ig-like domain-containing protein [Shewanella oncorhynchi]|uniref:Ig-like domain-containing protein n=1 Tax=Shewanella TaxID=22 RepID=UPI0039B0B2FB